MGEGFHGKVDDLVAYLVLMCDDKTSIAADEHVTHRKGLQETVAFYWKVRGVNLIMCT